ncbi:MAG: T9SS type A sorting domain-containing protein [Bacteroidetes bacterium]|nr:MAG: T9SS type A sorting domain-containing protein [Bacteroidota bacterium]
MTLTATNDNNGNSSFCTATVTVADAIAPTAACTGLTVQLDVNGSATISTSVIDNNSSDNCGVASLNLSKTSFNCSDVGANTVTLTATDNSGNSSACTANVMVEDKVAPAPSCQNVTVQLNASGNGSTSAGAVGSNSSDACGIASLALSKTSFDCSNVGANAVTLTVTDNNGNSSTCSATVTVEDKVAPAAICQNVTVQLDANGNGSTTKEAINNGSGDACGIANLALSQTDFNCSNVGANAVTLTVTDNNSNSSTCSATVTVTDQVAPIAVCQNVTVQLDTRGNGSASAGAVDNNSSDACGIANLSLSNTGFDCNDIGANAVTLTVTDNNGNSSTCSATVTVEDNVAPAAICQDVTIQLDADGNGTTYTEAINNGSSDACGIDGYALSQSSFDCSHVGANTVTLFVTDIHGNGGTCNAIVTVEDLIAPELSSELIFLGCKPEVNYDQYEVTGSASDNCGVGADSYVIALPYMESPTMVFSEKNNKMLKFLFIQNKIIVEAPGVGGAEAWWDEIEDQGGVAVSLGQVFDLSGVEGSNSINYLFDNNGDLKNVTAFSMTMVHTVTDLSGNLTSESYTVSRQCLVENRSNSNGSAQLTGNDPDVTKDKSAVNGVQVFPNPSANKTSIQYELLKPAAVLIDVIDLRGVRVARLLRADQDAGIHRINWDGSTPGGGPVVPGMYIIQLRIGAEILNKKVIRE